jgi:hypothetical protein
MFPIIDKKEIEALYINTRPTILTRHRLISIIILFILFYINMGLSSVFLGILGPINPLLNYNIGYLISVILMNLSLVPLFFFIIPKLGLPNGRESLDNYLASIKLSWFKKSFKFILWALIGFICIFISHYLLAGISNDYFFIPEEFILINPYLMTLILYFGSFFWQELLYRGIVLTMLLRDRKNSHAILLNVLIVLIFNFIAQYIFTLPYFYNEQVIYVILSQVSSFIIQLISAFLFVKTKSIIPGLAVHLLMMFIYVPGGIGFIPGVPYF